MESSPAGGGRAKLHSRNYALPGDKFTAYELHVFDVTGQGQKEIECQVDRIDFDPIARRGCGGIAIAITFTYQQVDRGHQRLRLVEVDAQTGKSRNLIDEKTETFIWTAQRKT